MTVRVMTLDIQLAMLLAAYMRDPAHGVTLMYADGSDGEVREPFELRGPYLRDCGCDPCGGWKEA